MKAGRHEIFGTLGNKIILEMNEEYKNIQQ